MSWGVFSDERTGLSSLFDPLMESSSLDPLGSSLLNPLLESSSFDPVLESSSLDPPWTLLYLTLDWSLLVWVSLSLCRVCMPDLHKVWAYYISCVEPRLGQCRIYFTLSWFSISAACCPHSFLMKSCKYWILNAMFKSRVGVRFGKFQVMQRTLFCRLCNFKRWLSIANSHGGQA
jgi:hypothetical protein